MTYFRKNIEAMAGYVPGEQPEAGQRVVKLNQNENPYPPSPAVLEALKAFDAGVLRLYPDPMAAALCKAAGEALGVPSEWILPGDGSDDLIMMLARAAAGPARPIAYPTPTFPFYCTQGQIEGAELVEVPAAEDFSLPVERLAEVNAALTFVCSPNSPTGATADADALAELAGRLSGILVIDEAYVDFADADALSVVGRCDNVIVLRTLSKGYSLAGLRLGFGIARPPLLEGLVKTKAIYNVGALPAALGAAAMKDRAYHAECVARIRSERARLAAALEGRGFVVWPSGGNFLMVTVPGGDGRGTFEALKARNVLVRYFQQDRLLDKLRISVGRPEDTDALLAALDDAGAGNTP